MFSSSLSPARSSPAIEDGVPEEARPRGAPIDLALCGVSRFGARLAFPRGRERRERGDVMEGTGDPPRGHLHAPGPTMTVATGCVVDGLALSYDAPPTGEA